MTPIFKRVAAAALLCACFHIPSAFVPHCPVRAVCAPRLSAIGHGDAEDFGDIERGDAMDDNELDGGPGSRMPPRSVLSRPWDVEVDLYGDRHNITVQPGDSILEAAEMAGMNLSYECRRGTCISCAAKVRDGSSGFFENRADRAVDDGAPEGFILTCSTYPTGPGVKLDLSANADMWAAYCKRLDDVNIRDLLREASAGIMTKYRVEHPEEFRREMERQFDNPEEA